MVIAQLVNILMKHIQLWRRRNRGDARFGLGDFFKRGKVWKAGKRVPTSEDRQPGNCSAYCP